MLGSEPVRVLLLNHSAAVSGGEVAILKLLPHLAGRGIDLRAVFAENGPMVDRYRASGCEVEVVPMTAGMTGVRRDGGAGMAELRAALGTIGYARAVARGQRAWRPHVVYANSFKSIVYGCLLGALLRARVIAHVRNPLTTDYFSVSRIRLVRACLRLGVVRCVANSLYTASSLRGIRTPVTVLSSPSLPAADGTGVVRRGGLVLVLGRFTSWKGQLFGLEVFDHLALEDPEVRLRVVGGSPFCEDDYTRKVLERIAASPFSTRVEVVGHSDDVATHYGEASVYLHTSRIPEPFGQTVIEAMSRGAVVVVPDRGGPSEVVSDGVDGFHYTMGDVSSALVALRSALAKGEADPMRLAATRTADRYDPAVIAAGLAALSREVAGAEPSVASCRE